MSFKSTMLAILCSFVSLSILATEGTPKPKLVVGLVVDQMRWDYLYKYTDRYSERGFKRLLKDGFSCENNYIPYVPTFTAIGHSTIYTGSVPAIHGITGNNFIIQASGKNVYCSGDDSVEGVGGKGKVGKHSPRNLLTSTITDQLKLATNFQSKVIGIAIKDRGSVLPVGHFADAAYWLDGSTGDWISSTYYMKDLPEWVKNFNKKKLADTYFKEGWNTLHPIETYTLSTVDNNPYEESFKGEKAPVFPRDLVKLKSNNGYDLIKSIPQGNTFTLDMAKEAIESENLGHNPHGVTDFLAISLSSTDYIGHQFAINSIEIEDTYLRLDADIASFIEYLDERVGKDNYTLFLTADHGAAHNAKFFSDKGGNSGYFEIKKVTADLNAKLLKKFGVGQIVNSLLNYQVHLNYPNLNKAKLDEHTVRDYIVKELRKMDGILFATDMDKAEVASIPKPLKEYIINGYNYKRSGVIQIMLEIQWYSSKKDSPGTTHGVWASYDTHIPVVFMGWGVKKGKSNRKTYMTDIAPTIAAMLKIEEPNGNIGVPIFELLE